MYMRSSIRLSEILEDRRQWAGIFKELKENSTKNSISGKIFPSKMKEEQKKIVLIFKMKEILARCSDPHL
jgi:hypothetical protein